MSDWTWLEPRGLWALSLLPALWLMSRGSRASVSPRRRVGSLIARSLCVIAVALALARPQRRVRSQTTSTVVLVDVSASIDDATLESAEQFVAQLRALDPHTELITFAEAPRRITFQQRGQTRAIARHVRGGATDIERAISLALGLFQPDAVPQLVLFSDGRQTHGSLERAVSSLAARSIALWIEAPHGPETREVGVLDLTLPDSIKLGEPFRLTARLVASVAMRVSARLLQNGSDSAPEAQRTLSLPAGETTLTFPSVVRTRGKVRYRLELVPETPDRFSENNVFERVASVRGAPQVLVIERESEQAYALLDLLRAASFEVELRTPEQAPQSAAELRELDFIILSDVPADALSKSATSALTEYVRDGGGLLIAGGERAFGLGGYRGSLLEPLSAVALSASARRDQSSLALMLLIDKSGSMAGEKLERAKEAALATAELLPPDSYLGVIGFDAQPEAVVRLALTGSKEALERKVSTLAAGGGTALFPALDAAYAALAGVRARVKHVVALTDGQTQEESLSELVRAMRADGITISTVGLGEEVNRGLLSELARLGAGRAYFTRDPSKVPRLFTEETRLLSRSLAVEERVRVRRVASADFLRGLTLEQAPPLRGYVSTSARAAPAQLLLESDRGEPLLARMRFGRGWSLAWTSDLKPRWAADWFSYRDFSRLLAQLIREHGRADDPSQLPIEAHVSGDTLHASIELLDEHARFVNGLTGRLEVTRERSGDRPETRTTELFQSAPGRYQAELPLPELGSYALRALLTRPDDPNVLPRLCAGSVSHTFPAEYRPPFAPAEAELRALSARTGGGRVPRARDLLVAHGRSAERQEERWPALVWLALVLFLGDLAIRRLPSPWRPKRQGT